MSELTFEKFAKQLTDASPILSDADIAQYILLGKSQPIMLYAYRIAAYVAAELRTSGKLPEATDDTDYIDAVQECILHTPQLMVSWAKKPTHKFASYVNRAFTNVISNYLWTLAKGGTGTWRSDAPQVDQLPQINEEGDPESDDYVANFNTEVSYEYPPQGYRDPLDELIAAEDEDRALRALQRPAESATATHQRNIRVRKQLGLSGVKHEACG